MNVDWRNNLFSTGIILIPMRISSNIFPANTPGNTILIQNNFLSSIMANASGISSGKPEGRKLEAEKDISSFTVR